MAEPIASILERYQPLTSEQIRQWSSGAVKRRLRPDENREDWREVRDTLWDQHIFGSVNDWECACGKFKGYVNVKVVCNVCGVRVVAKVARTIRFGHINLTARIPHPFFANTEALDAIPVVPACFWETVYGEPLARAYEEVLRCSLSKLPAEDIMGAYGMVISNLERLFEAEPGWDTEVADRLARGMAVKEREPDWDEKKTEIADAADQDEDQDQDEEAPDWDDLKLAPLDDE